jgi:hypothetical protein
MSACGGYDLKGNHNAVITVKDTGTVVYQYVRLRRIRFESKSQQRSLNFAIYTSCLSVCPPAADTI